MAGCGNSRMTEEMFEDGEFIHRLFLQLTSFFIDIFNPSPAFLIVFNN